jgi:hypothetical protein
VVARTETGKRKGYQNRDDLAKKLFVPRRKNLR